MMENMWGITVNIWDFVSLVFTYVFSLVILHVQGVPLNMVIQWRIRYRLFKQFFDLV